MFKKIGAFRVGVVGAVVTAVCCFTPVLVVLLGLVGLSWIVGYLDYVLFPALAFFLGLTVYVWWRDRRVIGTEVDETPSQ